MERFNHALGAKRLQKVVLPHPLKRRDFCELTFKRNVRTVINSLIVLRASGLKATSSEA